MILIRRKKINNRICFEIVDGPWEIKGFLVDYKLLLLLVKNGADVRDYDAIRAEQARWN